MSPRAGRARTWLSVGLASLALHVAPLAARALHARLTALRAPLAARMAPAEGVADVLRSRQVARYLGVASPAEVPRARAAMLERARAERGAGRLELGAFLIRAAALDAFERGTPSEPWRAEVAYRERLGRFQYEREQPERRDLMSLVSSAFGDLAYFGTGGSINDVLTSGGGACEGLTHLLAAALHDAGLGARTFVRSWGGGTVGHLAPVYRVDGREVDLLSGRAPEGGAELRADELIEVYARHHGLTPPLAGEAGPGQLSRADRATLSRGYPPNTDVFSGSVPLYAERAIASVRSQRAAGAPVEDRAQRFAARMVGLPEGAARDVSTCALRSIQPSAARVSAAVRGGELELWLERPLSGATLGALLAEAAQLEQLPPAGGVRGVGEAGCLHAIYALAARQLALAQRPTLAREAGARALAARQLAEQLAGQLVWTDELRRDLLELPFAELLAEIPSLADRLLEAAALSQPEPPRLAFELQWPAVMLSLVAEPHAQARALELVERVPIDRRLALALLLAGVDDLPRSEVQLPPGSNLARASRAMAALRATRPASEEQALALVGEHGMPASWLEAMRVQHSRDQPP